MNRAETDVRAPSARTRVRQLYRRKLRPAGREIVVAARRLVPGERMLPDFVVIGAKKSGTTSLHKYLIQHPRVLAPLAKETGYFDQHFTSRSPAWYLAHFPRIRKGAGTDRPMTGEASPGYLHHRDVPQRVRNLLPEVRLIVLLRDPVRRAYSQYQHAVDWRDEHLGFDDALRIEAARLAGTEDSDMRTRPEDLEFVERVYGYKQLGLYEQHLRRWLQEFPRDQLCVLETEQLYSKLPDTLGQIARFLGLTTWIPRSQVHFNVRRYPPMPPRVEAELREFFHPHNQRLCELLGMEFSWAR